MKEAKSIICNEIKDFEVFEEVLRDTGFDLRYTRKREENYLYICFSGNAYWYEREEILKTEKAKKLNYENFVWEFLKNFDCVITSVEEKEWLKNQKEQIKNPDFTGYYFSLPANYFRFSNTWNFYNSPDENKQQISFKNFQKLVNSIDEMKSPKYYIILKNSAEKKAFVAYLEEYKEKYPQIKAKIVPNTFYNNIYQRFRIFEDQKILVGSFISDNIVNGYEVLTFAEIEKFMKSLLDFYNKSEFVFSAGFKAVYNKEKNTITIVEKERKLEFWRKFTENLLHLNENIVISGLDISKEDVLEFKHWMVGLSPTNF